MARAFEENTPARRDLSQRLSSRLAKAALRAVGPTLEARSIGNALLVHPRGFVDNRALAFSERLAADPQHTLVVLDLPARPEDDVWETVARALDREGRSFRLVPGRGTREDVQRAAQWLADRLERVVLAPDGPLVPAAGGALFVPAHHGLGWLRYRPNAPSSPDSRRFPKPQWEYSVPDQPWQIGSGGTAEPLPGGVWIRGSWEDAATPDHRQRLIDLLAGDPDLLGVALGSPGASAALPLEDIAAFWDTLPSSARHLVRFVSYGPVALPEGAPLGQALADLLGQRVAVYAGLPSAGAESGSREIRTLQADGTLGWRPYADEFGYTPRGPNGEPALPPVPLNARVPAGATATVAPGIYQHGPDVLLEVVQSGLWVRPRNEPRDGHVVRSAPADPAFPAVLYDQNDPLLADHMRSVAYELLPALEPGFRDRSRVLPSHEVGRLAIAGQSPPAIQVLPGTAERTGALTSGRSEGWMLEGGKGAQAPQPVPQQTAGWTDEQAPATATGTVGQTASATSAPAAQPPAAPPLPGRLDAGPAPAGLPAAPAPSTRPVGAPEQSGPPAVPVERATATGAGPAPSPAPTPTPEPVTPPVPSAPAPTPEWTEDEEPDPEPPPAPPVEPSPAPPAPPAPGPAAPQAPPTPPAPASSGPAMPSIRLESSPSQPPAPARDSSPPPPPAPLRDDTPPAPEPPRVDAATPHTEDPVEVEEALAPAPPPPPPAGAGPGTVRVQPVPSAAASVLPPRKGVDKERDWVRRSLGERYDTAAAVVARVLSESPGLAGGPRGSAGEALTDLAAMRLYLSGSTPDIDAAIRSAASGPHVPLSRCATAGMRRLPSYRGGATLRATLNDAERAWYQGQVGKPIVEHSFLSALSSIRRGLRGNTDVVFWSLTARRTGLLAPELPDRLVFTPGTRFKVLRVVDGDRHAVLLRELAAPEVDEAGNLREERVPLDEIALNGLDQLLAMWKQIESDPEAPAGDPLPDECADAFCSAPGLSQPRPGRTAGPRPPAAPNAGPRRGRNT